LTWSFQLHLYEVLKASLNQLQIYDRNLLPNIWFNLFRRSGSGCRHTACRLSRNMVLLYFVN
jgi:hypothetical protein